MQYKNVHPTTYKTVQFRSMTEARWAVFFDSMRMEWQYEPQCFKLQNGLLYLPDFKVNYNGKEHWCEVKPKLLPTQTEPKDWVDKIIGLSKVLDRPVFMLIGEPAYSKHRVYQHDKGYWEQTLFNTFDEGEKPYGVLLQRLFCDKYKIAVAKAQRYKFK